MNGVVQSGADRQSIANATVKLHRVSGGQSTEIARATTLENGSFSAEPIASTAEQNFYYATASLGDRVLLMAILGSSIPPTFVINELTTVAAAYSAAQFYEGGRIQGDSLALNIVAAMNANLVDVSTGSASSVMTTSPNADETNSCRSLMSLANFLATAVRDRKGPLQSFFTFTWLPNQPTPANTVAALANLARNPARNVGAIYLQSKLASVYGPALEEQPVTWTLVVKVNDSGDDSRMFGGPGSIAFDSQGRGWIPNNVLQGTPNSSTYSIVLDMSGRPARDSNGKLISPISGGGLLGAGFGAAVDANDNAWFGDFGWGDAMPEGSASLFTSDGEPISPSPNGYTKGGMNRVQGTVVDGAGNVWFAGWGNGTVVCYRGGNPDSYAVYRDTSGTYSPFGIAMAKDGSAWVANSNGSDSDIRNLVLGDGMYMECRHKTSIGKVLKGIQIDSAGNIWVGSGGDHHVYVFDSEGKLIGGYQGGGTNGPWGITLDGDDNLWVGNFGPLEVGSVFHGRLTQLAGINAKGYLLGDALTPPTGYTLPSAGSPVLLHDGTPLYGPDGPPCFIPMMRTTGVSVDAAGNVWTCNNWKPDFDNDIGGNPGGDGMLIWVGLAKPVR
jgi:hypothetical protein